MRPPSPVGTDGTAWGKELGTPLPKMPASRMSKSKVSRQPTIRAQPSDCSILRTAASLSRGAVPAYGGQGSVMKCVTETANSPRNPISPAHNSHDIVIETAPYGEAIVSCAVSLRCDRNMQSCGNVLQLIGADSCGGLSMMPLSSSTARRVFESTCQSQALLRTC